MTEDLSSHLKGAFGRPTRHLNATGSTNADALAWAAGGAPAGAVVIADHQTEGRGRWGRTWSSEPGRSLLFSLVLRPDCRADRMGLVSVLAGVATAEAVGEVTGTAAMLKWPNDVVVEGKKLAGILAEGRTQGSKIEVAVIGIGLNLALPEDLPRDVAERATSLHDLGVEVPRSVLLAAILEGIESLYPDLSAGGAEIIRRAGAISTVLGNRITLRRADGSAVEATATGLTSTGALEIVTSAGTEVVDVAEVTGVRPA